MHQFNFDKQTPKFSAVVCNRVRAIRNSHPEVFLGQGVLKICRKFTGEDPSGSAIVSLFPKIQKKLHFAGIDFRGWLV